MVISQFTGDPTSGVMAAASTRVSRSVHSSLKERAGVKHVLTLSGSWSLRLGLPLTSSFLSCLEREFPLGCFADVVAGCGTAVLQSWRPAGAGLAGFRRAGWLGGPRADVPESAAHAGRGEPPGRGGPFPGTAQVISQLRL